MPGTRETDIRHTSDDKADATKIPGTDTLGTREADVHHAANDVGDYMDGTMTTFITLTEDPGWPHAYRYDPAFGSVYRAIDACVRNDGGFSLNSGRMLLFHTSSGGYDTIMVVIDRLAKMGVSIAYHKRTTAFHAQADGSVEPLNRTLEVALRVYVGDKQQSHCHLYLIQLAYNTATSDSTGFSPYELLYAQPQNIVERILRPETPPTHDNPATSEWMEAVSMQLADTKEAISRYHPSARKIHTTRRLPIPQCWLWDKPIRRGGYGGRIRRDMDRRIARPSNRACVLGTGQRRRSEKKVGRMGAARVTRGGYGALAAMMLGSQIGWMLKSFVSSFLFFFLSVFHACIQELWDIARRAGGPVRGGKPSSQGLAAWRLGAKAAW
jgi:hypothetical protein